MIRVFSRICLFFLSILIIDCGGKEEPTPDEQEIFLDEYGDPVYNEPFYPVEESIEDIQKQIDVLRARVIEYESKIAAPSFTAQLQELIQKPVFTHKISLANGTVIEGTIEKDQVDNLLVKTDVGTLTINKADIEGIEDLVLPIPDIVFKGDAREEIFDDRRVFKGKVVNQGSRRGDFVRVIFSLWADDTDLIAADSAFVNGTQIIYRSGIITDTILEPNQSAEFIVEVPIKESLTVEYVTREVRWLLYD